MIELTIELSKPPATSADLWYCVATSDTKNVPFHGVLGRGTTEEAAILDFRRRVSYDANCQIDEIKVERDYERGAASILIELEDGKMKICHGTDGDTLATKTKTKVGDWDKLWTMLEDFGFERLFT